MADKAAPLASQAGERSQGALLPDLDTVEIMRILPHRYPMLMIDRLVEVTAFERAVGVRNVTANEPAFQGHFPGNPIMPGVLIIEAMAQAAATLAMLSLGERSYGAPVYFMGIDETKFRRPVRPGDQLRLEVRLQRRRLGVWKYKCAGTVGGDTVAEALLTARLMLPEDAAGG